ncbi:hypothetical protein GOICGAJE_02523 [Bacillus sp. MB95]|nr:hypothetical protein [Bacillus sp. MB95]
MTNILFLRNSSNKNFFPRVAKELANQGHNCFHLIFELGDWTGESYKEVNTRLVTKLNLQKSYDITDNQIMELQIYNLELYRKQNNHSRIKKEIKLYKKYMYILDEFIQKNSIDIICMYNGHHWIDQIGAFLARKYSIKTFYFELGLFRPHTITLDTNGVNNLSSVSRKKTFFEAISIDQGRLEKYLKCSEESELNLTTNLTKHRTVGRVISQLGTLLNIHPNLFPHATAINSLKYYIAKKKFQTSPSDKVSLDKKYIFVPFQVSTDTQILFNSLRIKNMEQLVNKVVSAVDHMNEEYNTDYEVVFKEHPEDLGRVDYSILKQKYRQRKNVKFVKKYDMERLINNSELVITINSTVAIESLMEHKKVITLGEAFFNIEGLVQHCTDPDKLSEDINNILKREVNHSLINKFLYFLRFNYQVECNIDAADPISIKNVCNRLIQSI